MTDTDLDSLARGICPDCASDRFYLGPRGGAARNIECAGCGSRFNVTMFQGEVLLPQRIPGQRYDDRPGPYWTAEPRAIP